MRKGRLASIARWLAWAYVAALVGLILVLRFIGEDSWLVTPVLYFPRAVFALPLVVTLPAILYVGPRWMLATQVAAILLVLFPLMGLELHPLAAAADPATPKIRLLSFNVYFGDAGCEAIVDEVAAHDPDVVVLQAVAAHCGRTLAARFPSFHVHVAGEYVLGSRFPIRDVYVPPEFPNGRRTEAEYRRYTLETPIGVIDLYSVHPYSPRLGFRAAHGDGLRTELRQELEAPHVPAGRTQIEENTKERAMQVAAIAAAAAASTNLVVIAGDTNLPALSRIYARYLASGSGPWKDGFASVGTGFGYTFPTQWKFGLGPWMRIDRVLAGPGLRFLRFEVGGRGASDHCPVIAELAAP